MAQDNIICIRIEPSDAGNDQMESNKRIMIPARNLLRLVSQSQIHAGEMSPMDGRTFIMLERILGGQRGTLDNIVERGEKKSILSTCVPWVTEKRTPFRDITYKSRCNRSLTKVHRRHIDPKAIWRGTEDLNQAKIDGNTEQRFCDMHVNAHFFAQEFRNERSRDCLRVS